MARFGGFFYLVLKNMALPPGRRPSGPEAGPVHDPALRGSEFNGFAGKDCERLEVSVFRCQCSGMSIQVSIFAFVFFLTDT